jgi:hypothetical protein
MEDKCKCQICENDLPFEIPNDIIDSLLNNNLVLFAGAGISTETKRIFKETLYDDVFYDLNEKNTDISFPDLMSKFCNSSPNGRQKLLEKIKKRFDYVHQFKELYRMASEFHIEISKFWMLKDIITTNWDDYFERECSAIPIVTPKDFAFYNIDQRKVFKIHGSISNYGSVIATKEDYDLCYKELSTGLIGANLKTLLATKTILFVGYSFRDFDFNKVIELLKLEMGQVFPHFYIVTLDDKIPDSLDSSKVTMINTSGTFFFKKIREHLENKKIIVPEKKLNRIYEIKYLLSSVHSDLSDYFLDKKKSCSLIYTMLYQDGISHATDYLDFKSKSGESYNHIDLMNQLVLYTEDIRKKMSKARNYMDLAYIDGYIEGLAIPLFYEDIEEFPLFYIYGVGPTNDIELAYDTFKNDTIRHKASEKYGRKFFKEYLKDDSELVLHHRPFI